MVFENNYLVKKCLFENPSEIHWELYEHISASDLAKMIIKFNIVPPRCSSSVEIKVIVSSVVDNGNNYWIQGKFYDDGNFYFFRTWYYKKEKDAHIEFIPWPERAVEYTEMEYIQKMRA